jgi:Spy/CpxP family protein refolding chaperone
MVRQFAWAIGVAVLLTSGPAAAECIQQQGKPAAAAQPARPKFWQDTKLRQEIGITDQQSVALEQIFASSYPSLREAKRDLDTLEAMLSRTIDENTADLIIVSQQVDKVEAARSAYNKARTVMLYRMNLLLSREQRTKVKAMYDRFEEQRRRDERGKDDGRGKPGKNDRYPQ